MATKPQSKTGGFAKGKATAASNARQRGQRQRHMGEAPRGTNSNHRADQDRAIPESPLTGEDRPAGRRGGKQRGFEQNVKPARGRDERTPTTAAERSVRRASGRRVTSR
jgi:hypothetical protein